MQHLLKTFVVGTVGEIRYRNSVLQCYALVIHLSSGIFLSSLATASRLSSSNVEVLVSWRGFRADTLKRNMNHM
jgi:hypothetical protein